VIVLKALIRSTPRLALIMAVPFALLIFHSNSEQSVISWPDHQLRILDHSGRPLELRSAATKWNQTGLNMKVSIVNDDQPYDVVANAVKAPDHPCGHSISLGCATVGKEPALPWQDPILEFRDPTSAPQDRDEFAAVAAHEIGHLLGLQHNKRRCSLMNSRAGCREQIIAYRMAVGCPVLYDAGVMDAGAWCPSISSGRWMCGPSEWELRQLQARYGGKIAADYSPWCGYKKQVNWRGWCLYPSWVPKGSVRPDWINNDRCTQQAPERYLSLLPYAIKQTRARRQALTASGSDPLMVSRLLAAEKRWLALAKQLPEAAG
jgi:hypothetical protein